MSQQPCFVEIMELEPIMPLEHSWNPDRLEPLRLRWAGGHKMTLYAWARKRALATLPAAEPRFFDVAADARVLAHCNWQPDRKAAPTLLALHGLEGSSEAHYMRGLADKAFAAASTWCGSISAIAAAPNTCRAGCITPA